jgi:DNA-binding beta-propeller fold protein YncE
MEARKPQLDLKDTCDVGGRPGSLVVSPDGSTLMVFDQECARVSIVAVASWQVLARVDLDLPASVSAFVLADFEDSIFLGGLPGKVMVFSAASRRLSGAIPCGGDACGLGILPELLQAVLVTASAREGFIEFVGLSPVLPGTRLELPLPPVRDTLALLPSQRLGAVVLRDEARGGDTVALFECRPGAEVSFLQMEGTVRSVAFDSEGRFLYAACREGSALAVIDVGERRVVERVLLAGEPFGVTNDPLGKRLWALCEKLGHVAIIDPLDHSVFRRAQLPGLTAACRRIAFSPEGRLAVVAEEKDGCLSLIEGGSGESRYGEVDDRLEMGRDVGDIVWSPLGEEIYVASPGTGVVLRLAVDRGDQQMKDTDRYLTEQFLRRGAPAGMKNPLFPP